MPNHAISKLEIINIKKSSINFFKIFQINKNIINTLQIIGILN